MTKLKLSLAIILIVVLGSAIYSQGSPADDRTKSKLDQTASDAINNTADTAKNYTDKAIDNANGAAENYAINALNNYSDKHHAETLQEIEAIKNGTNATDPDGNVTSRAHNATTPIEAVQDLTTGIVEDEASVELTKLSKEAENATKNYTIKAIATKDGLIGK